MIGFADLQIPEKDLIKFKVIVLPGVYKDVLRLSFKHRDDTGKTDEFRACPYDRHHLQAFH